MNEKKKLFKDIQKLMRSKNWQEMEGAGLSKSVLSRIYNNNKSVKIETLIKYKKVLSEL